MATARDMMKGGLSAGQARAINGQVAASVVAAGTTITDATDLTASVSVIITAASGSGVQIPSVEISDELEILNLGANTVKVYPDSSTATINQLTGGAAFSLAVNTAVKVKKYTATKWMAWLSA